MAKDVVGRKVRERELKRSDVYLDLMKMANAKSYKEAKEMFKTAKTTYSQIKGRLEWWEARVTLLCPHLKDHPEKFFDELEDRTTNNISESQNRSMRKNFERPSVVGESVLMMKHDCELFGLLRNVEEGVSLSNKLHTKESKKKRRDQRRKKRNTYGGTDGKPPKNNKRKKRNQEEQLRAKKSKVQQEKEHLEEEEAQLEDSQVEKEDLEDEDAQQEKEQLEEYLEEENSQSEEEDSQSEDEDVLNVQQEKEQLEDSQSEEENKPSKMRAFQMWLASGAKLVTRRSAKQLTNSYAEMHLGKGEGIEYSEDEESQLEEDDEWDEISESTRRR